MPDWSLLRSFHAVAETGSLSAAARRLKLSQPTLGRQIDALEAEVGTSLFHRTRRGLTLTSAGESIREAVGRMEEAAGAVERRVGGSDALPAGIVRLSSSETLAVHWLLPHLARFRRRHAAITIELVIDNYAVDLARGEADVALRLFRPREPDLVARKVAVLGFGLYGARDYLTRHGAPRNAADLRRHHFVGFSDQAPAAARQVAWLAGLVPGARFSCRSDSLLAQFQAVRSGFGLGIVAAAIADSAKDLVRLLPSQAHFSMDVWLAAHADLKRSTRIRLLYDYLAELIVARREELLGRVATRKR